MAPKKKPARPPRRKPGTGAIRTKKERALPYETEFTHSDGAKQFDYFGTTEEAAAHLDRLVAERDDKDAPLNTAKGAQTFTQFLTAWLGIKAAHVSEKTLEDYTYQCDVAAGEGGMSQRRIRDINLMEADTMLASLGRKGYKNVSQMRMVLRQAFDYAVENDYIKKNPFQKAKAPKTKHKKKIALSEAQRAILLEYATIEGGMPLLPLWHLESRLAFRRGETLGLKWSDIDFDTATITIQRQRTTLGNSTITKDAPKGDEEGSKVRAVPIPPDLLEILKQHRLDQHKRAIADLDWDDQGFVFVGDHGRPPAANRVNKRLKKIIDRANAATPGALPTTLTPHMLRHTSLYLLALGGTPANVRKALSGHSTAKMDELYTSHAQIEDVRRALGG